MLGFVSVLKSGSSMSFKQAMIFGIGLLLFGIYTIATRKKNASKYAKSMKESRWYKWTKFDYSERYFQVSSLYGGVFLINMGLLLLFSAFVKNSANEIPQGFWHYIFIIWVLSFFGSGLVFILYLLWKFGRKNDKADDKKILDKSNE